jgi:positive regulator of sigma E activity
MIHTDRCCGGRSILAVLGMALAGLVMAAFIAVVFGFVVMALWNWLMPDLFGLKTITFYQAWGLVLLSHILFKSFPAHLRHAHDARWKEHFRKKVLEHKAGRPAEGCDKENE